MLIGDATLEFANDFAGEDTMIGFGGTPWHTHGCLGVVIGENLYVEYDEVEVMHAIARGELVLRSSWRGEELLDRWIAHHTEPLPDQYTPEDEHVREWRSGSPR